jgi:hypothetical protein
MFIWFPTPAACELPDDTQNGRPRHHNKGKIVKKLEIFVITAEGPTPKRLELEAEATVADLIKSAHGNGEIKMLEEVMVFVEDEDEPLDHSRKLGDCGFREKPFIHCHRCRHIAVTVNYNGTLKEKKFSPSATVAKVLKWAVKEFGLKGQDAEDKVLRIDAQSQPLEPETHVGSLAKHSVCSLNLFLTPAVLVNG